MLTNLIKLHQEIEKAGVPIYGVTADGRIDFKPTASEMDRIIALNIVNNFNPSAPSDIELEDAAVLAAKTEFKTIPNWATWTPQQASDFINGQIFTGQTIDQINAWIDANVTTLATAKTGLKNLAAEIITIRSDMAKMAQMIMLIRNIAIRNFEK